MLLKLFFIHNFVLNIDCQINQVYVTVFNQLYLSVFFIYLKFHKIRDSAFVISLYGPIAADQTNCPVLILILSIIVLKMIYADAKIILFFIAMSPYTTIVMFLAERNSLTILCFVCGAHIVNRLYFQLTTSLLSNSDKSWNYMHNNEMFENYMKEYTHERNYFFYRHILSFYKIKKLRKCIYYFPGTSCIKMYIYVVFYILSTHNLTKHCIPTKSLDLWISAFLGSKFN